MIKTNEQNRDPYISVYLIAAQLIVLIGIDLFENICRWFRFANSEQFNFKNQCSAAGDNIASTSVTITQLWWNGQFTSFTWVQTQFKRMRIWEMNIWEFLFLAYSPTHMSRRPWSQPLITCPWPISNENGWSRSKLQIEMEIILWKLLKNNVVAPIQTEILIKFQ